MFRRGIVAVLIAGFAAAAGAQSRPIQWISNSQQGVAKARRSGLPIMFYITSSSKGERGDLKQQQQRAFRDRLVSGLARERFVPVRLANSTTTKSMLKGMGAPVGGDQLVFSTPTGEFLGVIGPGEIRNPGTLARGMMRMFREYRNKVFNAELKPILESESSSPGKIIKALKTIDKLLILDADKAVAELLKRDNLSKTVAKQTYRTLATLSTSASVKALLEAAPLDKQAALALAKCTPGGAEDMLPALDLENPAALIPAYEAATKICKIKGKKPRGFWNGANGQILFDELERVKKEVKRVSKRWKDKYADYR